MLTLRHLLPVLAFGSGLVATVAIQSCSAFSCRCTPPRPIVDAHYAECAFDEGMRWFYPEGFIPFPYQPSAFSAVTRQSDRDEAATVTFEYVVNGATVTVMYERLD